MKARSPTQQSASSSSSPMVSAPESAVGSNAVAAAAVAAPAQVESPTLDAAQNSVGPTPPPSSTLRMPADYDGYTELVAGKAPPAKPAETKGPEGTAKPAAAPAPEAATGIASKVAVGRFVTAAKEVETGWTTLTAAERANKLGKAANDELKAVGVPGTGTVTKPLAAGRNGELDFTQWNLDLNETAFQAAATTKADMAGMSDTVYHESRHAEQWHRMARVEAGKGKDAAAIASALFIPASVAQDAAKKPLSGDSTEAKEGEAWHKSVYGADSAARNTTLGALSTDGAALTAAGNVTAAAQKAHDDLAATGTATPEQIAAALKTWTDAYAAYEVVKATFDVTYQAYLDLPEEKDAWAVGGAVSAAYGA